MLIKFAALLALSIAVLVVAIYAIVRRHETVAAAEMPAEPDWSPEELAAIRDGGDPLTRPLAEIELADPLLYQELSGIHPVNLEWRPVDFTTEWRLLGTSRTGELPQVESVEADR